MKWYKEHFDEVMGGDLLCPFCGKPMAIRQSGHDDGSVDADCDSCQLMGGHYDSEFQARLTFRQRSENADFLPCPMCGKMPSIYHADGAGWVAFCGTDAFTVQSFASREKLKERWNRRA